MPPHHHLFDDIVHKALSSNIRKDILLSLAKKSKYLSEIAEEIDKKPQTVDFHLTVLSEIGLVESEWLEGKKYYQIKDPKILDSLKDQKSIPAGFRPKPPHEIMLDAWVDISKKLDRIEEKLDALAKK